jgi:hypothetical protein
MPLVDEKVCGTEKNGSKNHEYCMYCYNKGEFTKPDISMEEMIETCVGPMSKKMSEQEARTMLKKIIPGLKRWKKGSCCCCHH